MTPELAVDMGREALRLTLLVGGPLLAAALVAGLISGVLQASAQVHEHSLSFIPRLAAVGAVLAIGLPWLLAKLAEYAGQVIQEIPQRM